jgi:hypothetical protein
MSRLGLAAHRAHGVAWALLGAVGAVGCGILTTAPVPSSVRVDVSGEDVVIELVQLDNPGSRPLSICLENVVLQSEGGGAECAIADFRSCVAMAPRSKMSDAPFQGRAPCGLLPSGRVRLLGDLRFRRTSTPTHADVWQIKTILTTARVRHLEGPRRLGASSR